MAMIRADPHRFVGQQVLNLSSAPTTPTTPLVRRNVVLRSFAVRSGASYTAMLGGLARVSDDRRAGGGRWSPLPAAVSPRTSGWSSEEPMAAGRVVAQRGRSEDEAGLVAVGTPTAAMVPRVLSDLFWFGRYAERAEDLLRLILATRTVAIETDMDLTPGRPLEVLLQAVTHVSTAIPASCGPASR